MAHDLQSVILNQVHPEWEKEVENFLLWRAATEARLDGGLIVPQDITSNQPPNVFTKEDRIKGQTVTQLREFDTYLYRLSHLETPANYNSRLLLAHDFGDSKVIVESYTGHLMRPKRVIDFAIDEETDLKIKENVDNMDTTLEVFEMEIAQELFAMGRCWVVTDADEFGTPLSYIIPREDMLDWHCDSTGSLLFAKFQMLDVMFDGVERQQVKKIILITREKWFICTLGLDQTTTKITIGQKISIEEKPNNLGFIPVRDAWLGSEGRPIIEQIAKLQLDLMNLDSEKRQIIRNQALSILVGPKGIKKQLQGLSANSLIELGNDDRNLEWIPYPAQTLDAHKDHGEWLVRRMFQLARLNNRTDMVPESGLAKSFNFLDTEAVLITAAIAVEGIMKQIIKDWAAFRGKQLDDVTYSIDQKFDIKNLKEKLEIAIQSMALDLGDINEVGIKKAIVEELDEFGLRKLTPEEKELSEKQIEEVQLVTEQTIRPELFEPEETEEKEIELPNAS